MDDRTWSRGLQRLTYARKGPVAAFCLEVRAACWATELWADFSAPALAQACLLKLV